MVNKMEKNRKKDKEKFMEKMHENSNNWRKIKKILRSKMKWQK